MEQKNIKTINLSEERITDLLNFINNRIQLGVSGNLIGEIKSITDIIAALETALMKVEEPPVIEETKKDE